MQVKQPYLLNKIKLQRDALYYKIIISEDKGSKKYTKIRRANKNIKYINSFQVQHNYFINKEHIIFMKHIAVYSILGPERLGTRAGLRGFTKTKNV